MDSLSVQYALGYHGAALHYGAEGIWALAVCGNSVCKYSLVGEPHKPLFWASGWGISASAYNPDTNWFAYAEKGLQPAVYVYACEEKRVYSKLTGVADLEVSALAFSKQGLRLFVAAREPDFRLTLWDLSSEEPVKLAEGNIDWAAEFASFNPLVMDQICLSGPGQICIWTYENKFHRTSFVCRSFKTRPYEPYSHAWSDDGEKVYIGGVKGEIMMIDLTWKPNPDDFEDDKSHHLSLNELIMQKYTKNAMLNEMRSSNTNAGIHLGWKVLRVLPNVGKIVSICVGNGHIVAIESGGYLCWLKFPSNSGEKKMFSSENSEAEIGPEYMPFDIVDKCSENQLSEMVYEMNIEVQEVTNMQYKRDQTQLVVGSARGSIVAIRVNIESLNVAFSEPSATTLLKDLAQATWRGIYHNGAILGLATLGGGKFILTCGQDGTMRVWEAEQGKELSRHCFKSAQTCIDSFDEFNVAVTGSETGSLCIFKVNSMGRSAILFQSKLHTRSIDKVKFSMNARQLIAASKTDGRIYFLKCDPQDLDDVQLLGYAVLEDCIFSLAWDISNSPADLFLFVSLARGEIVKLNVPSARASTEVLQFDNKALKCVSFRTQAPLLEISVGKYYLEKEQVERKVIWGMGQDKKLQKYRLPEGLQGWNGPDGTPLHAHYTIPAHAKPGYAMMLHKELSILVSGAGDGALQIRTAVLDPIQQPQKVIDVHMYDAHMGGITCVSVSGGRIFIGGANGVLFCCEAPTAGIKKLDFTSGFNQRGSRPVSNAPEKLQLDSSSIIDDTTDELTMLEKYEQSIKSRSTLADQASRTEIRQSIQKLKQEFYDILNQNEKASDLERLSPSELIVEQALESQLRSEGEKRVADFHKQVNIENIKKDILVERIKNVCWESMENPGDYLWPFLCDFEVPNFPLHRHDPENIRASQVAKLLRIVEIQENAYIRELKSSESKEQENAASPTTGNGINLRSQLIASVKNKESIIMEGEGASESEDLQHSIHAEIGTKKSEERAPRRSSLQIASEGKTGIDTENSANTLRTTQALSASEDEQQEREFITTEKLENGTMEIILYGSFELITSKRKRTQRYLLYWKLHQIRESFNKQLEETQDAKMSTIEKIRDMTSRVHELQKILSLKDELVLPVLDRKADLNEVFTVRGDEIKVPKYVDDNRLGQTNLFQQRSKQENNTAERALQDMMDGKLELKKEEISVEAEIERPAWMSGNPKMFTKEQMKEIKEFEAKLKAIKEEKEKKQRAQESEMRKLKSDIQDLMNNFDKILMSLWDTRLQDESRCIEVEETITRLSMEIEEEEIFDERTESIRSERLEDLKKIKGKSAAVASEFRREVDEFKSELDATIAEDKALDRNFKKDFADCGEFVNILYKHFRRRKPQITKTTPKVLSNKDPRQSISEKRKSIQVREKGSFRSSVIQNLSLDKVKTPIDAFNDRPEEIDPYTWERLLSARNQKIFKEEEVKKMTDVIAQMNEYFNHLILHDEVNRKRFEKALRDLAEFRESREWKRRNLALSLHIKQGLVEIDLKPLSGDYSDAALLSRALVVEFNQAILKEAEKKIKILIEMKDFKRGIYDVQWEIQRLRMHEKILVEKIRYIQLLRNTKALQMVIKNGEEVSNTSESSSIEKRLEHNKSLHEKRVLEKNRYLVQLEKKFNLMKKMNAENLQQASRLYQEYVFKARLCSKSIEGDMDAAAIKEKFMNILARKHLRDQAKSKVQEVERLQGEIIKIKHSNYPTFE